MSSAIDNSRTRSATRNAEAPAAQAVAVSLQETKKARVTLASVPRRIAGAAIDALLIMVVVGVITPTLRSEGTVKQIRIDAQTGEQIMINPHAELFDIADLLPFLVTAVYLIVAIATLGRTMGGWVVGITCVNAKTGGRPGWAVSTKRWFALFGIAAVLSIVPVIGPWAWLVTIAIGISPLWDRSGWLRGYHDRFAGDIVVRG